MNSYEIDVRGKINSFLRRDSNNHFNPAKILVLSFAAIILIGSILLSLPIVTKSGQSLPYLDALFTSTSAVCVTGLVVVDTANTFNLLGQIIILILIQVGGLGIMTFAALVAMALGKKISFKQRLVLQENLNQNSIQGIVRLVRYVLTITAVLELTGALILGVHWFPEMGAKAFYYGIFHSISAFNNAGFDIMGDFRSLTPYATDIITNTVIMLLILFGGLGFFVLWDLYFFPQHKKLSFHSKIVLTATGILLVISFFAIFLLEYNNPETLGNLTFPHKILASSFMAVTPRTAGFSTLDIAALNETTLFFIIILMFIGASPGSTAGGVKTSTIAVVLATTIANVRGIRQAVLYERAISTDTYIKAYSILFLALALVTGTAFFLSITEDTAFMDTFFEAVSAFGTVGLSTGITPSLSLPGKLVIIFTMFVGRVGPLTLAYVLGEKTKDLITYPTGNILIG